MYNEKRNTYKFSQTKEESILAMFIIYLCSVATLSEIQRARIYLCGQIMYTNYEK